MNNLFSTQKIKAGDVCLVIGNNIYDYESKKNLYPQHFLQLNTLVFVNYIIKETETAVVTSINKQKDFNGRKLVQYIAIHNLKYEYEYE